MNLIEESFQTKEEKKKKMATKIILGAIIVVVLVIVGIVSYLLYVQSTILRVTLDGQQNDQLKQLLVFEDDGTIYVPIRAISPYLGYTSYSGEYSNRSEDNSKCYVEGEDEVVNLTLNSNKIYKLNVSANDNNYTYIYIDKPVRAINGELYITTDGMRKVFNTTFFYDQENNRITINTTPFLISAYANVVLDYGYTKISENFENQKSILRNMLIVTDGRYYGVINASDGTVILECKYDDIIYQEQIGDFIVNTNGQYGIIGADRQTKVAINYNSIELMDYDAGLYLVKRNNRFGIVDLKGNTVIYPENDQIGVDISRFEENDLKTGYILVGNLIPVLRDDKWGLFDLRGNQLVPFEYDSFGYISNNDREATNLLVIPSYNVIVGCIDDRYTLLNSSGEQPIRAFVDDIYMRISGGEKHYEMIANNRTYDVEEYLDRLGVQSVNNNTDTMQNDENTNNTVDTENNNDANGNSNGDENSNDEADNGEENNQ